MSSIKCQNCGLVNFSSQSHCKRCCQTLNAAQNAELYQTAQPSYAQHAYAQPTYQQQPRPTAANYAYQPNQAYAANYAPAQPQPAYFQMPSPVLPAVCIKCGINSGLSLRNFTKTYTPPLCYLGILMGIVPFLLLVLLLRKNHNLHGAFCDSCWNPFSNASAMSLLFGLGCIFTLIGAVVVGIMTESFFIGMIGFALGIGVAIWGGQYDKKISPKYKRVNSHEVVIEVPGAGEVDFTRLVA